MFIEAMDDTPRWAVEPIKPTTAEGRTYVAELNHQLHEAGYGGPGSSGIPDAVRLHAAMAARAVIDARKVEAARAAIDARYAEATAAAKSRLSIIAASAACSDLMAHSAHRRVRPLPSAPLAATPVAESHEAAPEAPEASQRVPDWLVAQAQRPGLPKSSERVQS